MTAATLELIFYAFIAFILINRLLSILGKDDDNPNSNQSFFGENNKTVTDVTDFVVNISPSKRPLAPDNIAEILQDPNNLDLLEDLQEVAVRIEKFHPEKFLSNSIKAMKMIIESINNNDIELLNELVDKRYIEKSLELKDTYKTLEIKKDPIVKFSDVTFFGNSVIIRLVFEFENFTSQEWSFSKNSNDSTPNWFLTNIENYQHD